MEYCNYHPLTPATQKCSDCHTSACDECVITGEHYRTKNKALCHVCRKPTISLGSGFGAEPFWRRLDQSFKYPINTQSILVIVLVAILSSIVSFLPFATIFILAVNGAFLKYGFACLENSTYGNFKPVNVSESFEGGLSLIVQFLVIIFGLMIMVGIVGHFIGLGPAQLLGAVFLLGFPAIIINFALSRSIFNALNPLTMLNLITTIGLPYGLLLALIFIMIGSVGLITQLLLTLPEFLAVILGTAVSNYYSLVAFHIMGYMIFQYQHKLGFIAEEDTDNPAEDKGELETLENEIRIWVKEGETNKVLELYNKALERFPNNNNLYNKCYRFLIETRNTKRLKNFANIYFDHLIGSNNPSRLTQVIKEIKGIDKEYLPKKPLHRHTIAKISFDKGDFLTTIKLLNGLHKSHPEYDQLGESYDLLAEAIELSPKLKNKAEQYRKLATAIHKKNEINKTSQSKKSNSDSRFLQSTYKGDNNLAGSTDLKELSRAQENTEEENTRISDELPPIDFPGFKS